MAFQSRRGRDDDCSCHCDASMRPGRRRSASPSSTSSSPSTSASSSRRSHPSTILKPSSPSALLSTASPSLSSPTSQSPSSTSPSTSSSKLPLILLLTLLLPTQIKADLPDCVSFSYGIPADRSTVASPSCKDYCARKNFPYYGFFENSGDNNYDACWCVAQEDFIQPGLGRSESRCSRCRFLDKKFNDSGLICGQPSFNSADLVLWLDYATPDRIPTPKRPDPGLTPSFFPQNPQPASSSPSVTALTDINSPLGPSNSIQLQPSDTPQQTASVSPQPGSSPTLSAQPQQPPTRATSTPKATATGDTPTASSFVRSAVGLVVILSLIAAATVIGLIIWVLVRRRKKEEKEDWFGVVVAAANGRKEERERERGSFGSNGSGGLGGKGIRLGMMVGQGRRSFGSKQSSEDLLKETNSIGMSGSASHSGDEVTYSSTTPVPSLPATQVEVVTMAMTASHSPTTPTGAGNFRRGRPSRDIEKPLPDIVPSPAVNQEDLEEQHQQQQQQQQEQEMQNYIHHMQMYHHHHQVAAAAAAAAFYNGVNGVGSTSPPNNVTGNSNGSGNGNDESSQDATPTLPSGQLLSQQQGKPRDSPTASNSTLTAASYDDTMLKHQIMYMQLWQEYYLSYFDAIGVQRPPENAGGDSSIMEDHQESFLLWRRSQSQLGGGGASAGAGASEKLSTSPLPSNTHHHLTTPMTSGGGSSTTGSANLNSLPRSLVVGGPTIRRTPLSSASLVSTTPSSSSKPTRTLAPLKVLSNPSLTHLTASTPPTSASTQSETGTVILHSVAGSSVASPRSSAFLESETGTVLLHSVVSYESGDGDEGFSVDEESERESVFDIGLKLVLFDPK
ncbi:hypothetical protein HDU97_010028 [Phlyctochytrium planicorne]|nr:hypothetical protein HDU97_010028 [Phlyctochytrium planicorne]